MPQTNTAKFLQKDPSFKLIFLSVLIFIIAAFLAWEAKVLSLTMFRSNHHSIIVGAIILIADLLLLCLSYYLLKRNKIKGDILGLSYSRKTYLNVLIGIAIGITLIAITAVILKLFVPYKLVYKSASIAAFLSNAYGYLVGSFLEELMFRGFLLVVFSKLFGWRIGLIILALPFGLFHLQSRVIDIPTVLTTALYSLVFGLAYIVTRSLWTAVFGHATVNILLHVVTGLDGAGTSFYALVLEKQWPANYPVGVIVAFIATAIVGAILYAVIVNKEKKTLAV